MNWKSKALIGFLFISLLALPQGEGQQAWAGESTKKTKIAHVQQAYDQSKFQEGLNLLGKLSKQEQLLPTVIRLKALSLARLGKTAEGLDVYNQLIKKSGRENESLLRELAIAIILPFRADMREQVRGAAYTALKEIGEEDIVPFLEEGLGDGSGMIRALVAEGLGRLKSGQRSKRFQQALKDKAGLVRATVLKGLGRSEEKAHGVLIRPFLKDKQVLVQVAAAGAMVKLGHTEFWERVKKSALQDEGYERGAAYRVLGELGDPRGIDILRQGLNDRQPSIRAAAASSLGKLHMDEAIPFLMAALNEKSPAVRSVAAVSLGRLNSVKAIPALTKSLKDGNPGVRAASVAALLTLSSPFSVVAQTVRELIQEKNPGIRSAIAKALGNGHGRDVVGTLYLLLNDPVPKPRITAARSLGRIGNRNALSRLKLALRDQDEAVRATVAAAIVRVLSRPNSV